MATVTWLTRLALSLSPRVRRARKTRRATTATSCAVADLMFQLK